MQFYLVLNFQLEVVQRGGICFCQPTLNSWHWACLSHRSDFILFFAMLELKIRWRWKLSIANIRGQHNGARRSLLEEQRVEQHLLVNWGYGGRNFWRSRSRPCARTKGSIKRERVRQSKIGEFCTSAGTDINAVIDVTEKELWEQYHNRFN